MTFCPLTFWLTGGEFQELYQGEYIKMGEWFDNQASEINNALYRKKTQSLTPISTDDFTSFTRQAAQYKAKLIKLLAKGILTIPIEE